MLTDATHACPIRRRRLWMKYVATLSSLIFLCGGGGGTGGGGEVMMSPFTFAFGDGGATPLPWPAVHTHVEMMWNVDAPTEAASQKQFYYDFPARSMRVDNNNFQSFWLNDTLSMVVPGVFCQQLQMGFGMMKPDWMIDNATNEGDLWLTRRLQRSPGYDHTRWNRKSALPDGWFDYFSVFTTGEPYRMSAPSPAGKVVNEYYDFVPQTSFPAGTFTLPETCNKKNSTAFSSLLAAKLGGASALLRTNQHSLHTSTVVMMAVHEAMQPLLGHIVGHQKSSIVAAMQTLVAQAMVDKVVV